MKKLITLLVVAFITISLTFAKERVIDVGHIHFLYDDECSQWALNKEQNAVLFRTTHVKKTLDTYTACVGIDELYKDERWLLAKTYGYCVVYYENSAAVDIIYLAENWPESSYKFLVINKLLPDDYNYFK